MGKLIPNTFNLLVVIAVALGSTACSYGMAVRAIIRPGNTKKLTGLVHFFHHRTNPVLC